MTASTVLRTKTGRCEARARVALPVDNLSERMMPVEHSENSSPLPRVVVCALESRCLKTRQHTEPAVMRGRSCTQRDLFTRLSPEDVGEGGT